MWSSCELFGTKSVVSWLSMLSTPVWQVLRHQPTVITTKHASFACAAIQSVISHHLIDWHPVSFQKLPMSVELPISSSPFFLKKSPRVRPCECGCIHEDALFPIPPGGFNFSADGATVGMPGCYFPG
ncbi:hypothetical protein DAPPUDRAFT_101178 [Daphnia pulex]|uniref:Uncharacterized protein n=1 Tax=Daphnia pulex TaxID=6669 RepID=E9GCL4_DAPPU|nr:hypothetical protein DAPPUDRAFT_101178 [Daphnia pulex]|eukprot:EFX82845.1 hypothetical protein DAPPUDRAFT_101178 [Daphnia pulex]